MIASIAKTKEINGTSLQGYVVTTFAELLKTVGEPTRYDLDKVTVEWGFKSRDGVVFTIYDYKEQVTPTEVYRWHIGGHTPDAVLAVAKVFPNLTEGR